MRMWFYDDDTVKQSGLFRFAVTKILSCCRRIPQETPAENDDGADFTANDGKEPECSDPAMLASVSIPKVLSLIRENVVARSGEAAEIVEMEIQPAKIRGCIDLYSVFFFFLCCAGFCVIYIVHEMVTHEPLGLWIFLLLFLCFVPPAMTLTVWLTTISTKLTITNKKVILYHGFFVRKKIEVSHSQIRGVVIHLGLLERVFGVGSVILTTSVNRKTRIKACRYLNPEFIQRMIQWYQGGR